MLLAERLQTHCAGGWRMSRRLLGCLLGRVQVLDGSFMGGSVVLAALWARAVGRCCWLRTGLRTLGQVCCRQL